MRQKLAVVVGFMGKLPYAGMSLFNIHYMIGLRELGYDVHYVERQDCANECYDPCLDEMTDDPSYAIQFLREMLPLYGIDGHCFSFIDRENRCHGAGWGVLLQVLRRADFVLTLATPTWFDELAQCARRAFVDGDPLFTQAAMLEGKVSSGAAPWHYNALFTYAVRMGQPDCEVPSLGCRWIPTRPVIATRFWEVRPAEEHLPPVSALMHWAAGSDVSYNGRTFGHKNREFERFVDLPKRTSQSFELAVGGPAPREYLRERGWTLVNPLQVTGTIKAYKEFIAHSLADFGIAKHAYVASRSGWFSDRSTCYLASGRPVLHQDTGFSDWLPAGEGVLAFSNVDEVLDCLRRLEADYAQHARAARRIAEEYFEAAKVLARMLDDAGYK